MTGMLLPAVEASATTAEVSATDVERAVIEASAAAATERAARRSQIDSSLS